MQRYSKNRQAILHCLRGTDSHPTAEWVHAQLKPLYPSMSLGTVYRNLTQLKETGDVRSMGVVAGREHFDGNAAPHPHVLCERCGAIRDLLTLPAADELHAAVRRESGFTVSDMVFLGQCPDCMNEMNHMERSDFLG